MFDTSLFDSPNLLFWGAVTGLVFGFLLEKGGLTRYETIVGQFLLRDFTVMKVMLTAIVVGSVGIYGMLQADMIGSLHIKPAHLVANLLGGVIFGVGMALLGYCPGTGVAAIGSGARDARWGLLGMLAGAALYAETYPFVGAKITALADWGKVTLVDVTGLSAWIWIGLLAVVAACLFWWLERRTTGLPQEPSQSSAASSPGPQGAQHA